MRGCGSQAPGPLPPERGKGFFPALAQYASPSLIFWGGGKASVSTKITTPQANSEKRLPNQLRGF